MEGGNAGTVREFHGHVFPIQVSPPRLVRVPSRLTMIARGWGVGAVVSGVNAPRSFARPEHALSTRLSDYQDSSIEELKEKKRRKEKFFFIALATLSFNLVSGKSDQELDHCMG